MTGHDAQDLLVGALAGILGVRRWDDDAFELLGDDGTAARLLAPEPALRDYLRLTAADGLAALGAVGGDRTGIAAAAALLSVQLEEEFTAASAQGVLRCVRVRADRLEVLRADQACP